MLEASLIERQAVGLTHGLSRFSPIAYFFIDRKGRRFLLIVSLAAMIPLLIATGFSFEADSNSAQTGVVATFLMLFTLAYSPGAGVVPFLYSSEIFPQVLRGKSYDLLPPEAPYKSDV